METRMRRRAERRRFLPLYRLLEALPAVASPPGARGRVLASKVGFEMEWSWFPAVAVVMRGLARLSLCRPRGSRLGSGREGLLMSDPIEIALMGRWQVPFTASHGRHKMWISSRIYSL
jgi:hypothetical protein